jgi:MT0933-like antitoxin protein
MSEPNKLSERASELASQAVEAAGPVIERAKVVAGDLAEKAGPYVEKAAGLAAQGVAAAAEQIDKATGGKYSDKISSVSGKVKDTLDPNK